MKIATMVRGFLPVPRPADMVYAPIDLAESISEILTERGHEVTYFSPNSSRLKGGAQLETMNLRPLVHSQDEFKNLLGNTALMSHYFPQLWDAYYAREMFERASRGEYDLLHFHHPEVAAPLAALYPNVPVVYTLHDPIYDWYKEFIEMYQTPNQHFISISDNQRRGAPDLNYAGTVYNGIDLDMFQYSDHTDDDYLLISGRIVPEKGIKEAIEVAIATNHRLLIIGPVYADAKDYYEQHVKPFLNERIIHLGFVERDSLPRYYQMAKAVLFPIQWEEPFGLTMVEAMACGTPVIAMRRGSVEEVIKDGETGFIVNSIADMIDAVDRVGEISGKKCREHVEKNFSSEDMVDAYEKVFTAIAKPQTSAKKSTDKLTNRTRNAYQKVRTSLNKRIKRQ